MQYTDELVSSDLINLNNYTIEDGVVNIGEVRIPEPLKPAVSAPTPNGTKPSKNNKSFVLTGNLEIVYPGKTIEDVGRVFLTDFPTNDDKNVASGLFKIPIEKPFADGLYKISVEFKDGTISPPTLKKLLAAPNAKGELSLGTLPVGK